MNSFFTRFIVSVSVFIFFCHENKAQLFSPPAGVYCSCGPTTGVGNGSVDPSIAAKPFVKGILVRVPWNLLEPTDNSYNWQLIDGQIAAANQHGKKISLAIGCGIAIPQWVFDAGAQRLVTSVPVNDTIAVPWDAFFLQKWTDFISILGNRYKNDTTIRLVYMTASTGNGFEMQLPFACTPTLSVAGYTDAKMINSWKTVIDAFNTAFPRHFLTNDFHPVNSSNTVADSVYAYAHSSIGERYGANAWWWTQKNTTVYPSQYALLQQSASGNRFTGVQMAYSGTSSPSSFGTGGMPAALQLAIDNGIYYWELWNNDILNPDFDSLLTNVKTAAAMGMAQINKNNLQVFPNPANNQITISWNDNTLLRLMLTDVNGKTVMEIPAVAKTDIDISALPASIYFLVIESAQGSFVSKIIKQ